MKIRLNIIPHPFTKRKKMVNWPDFKHGFGRGGMWLNWLTDSIREFIHRGDRALRTLCLLASGFGMVLIYSATVI